MLRRSVWGSLALGLMAMVFANPTDGLASSSVDTYTGAYDYAHTDLTLNVGGNQLAFTRTYYSKDPRGGGLGFGWMHNFQMRLTKNPDNENTVLELADGRSDQFQPLPDGFAAVRQGSDETLIHTDDGYEASVAGQHLTFDLNGRLVGIRTGTQPRLTVAQGPYGPTQVVDANGEPLMSFDYGADTGIGARLLAVTDNPNSRRGQAEPRSTRFGYDFFGRLTSVTDRMGRTTTYTYPIVVSELTRIIDARGHTALSIAYDATGNEGKVVARTDARGLRSGWQNTLAYTRRGSDDA